MAEQLAKVCFLVSSSERLGNSNIISVLLMAHLLHTMTSAHILKTIKKT